jgi:valyl-tRNA synthetase
LENKRFVENAPAKVVEMENSKKEDAERKIEILEKKLISLS